MAASSPKRSMNIILVSLSGKVGIWTNINRGTKRLYKKI